MSQKEDTKRYQLLDSGHGKKLEKFGEKVLVRPSSQSIWKPRLPHNEWRAADAEFIPSGKQGEGKWRIQGESFETWTLNVAGVTLELRLQSNGQVGIFPEHASYLPEVVKFIRRFREKEGKAPSVLNLFAYTGLASVVCLKEGAKVCHVDLSKKALTWATENFSLNGFREGKFRLICDDAVKFVEREVSRGNRYDLIIADPPSFSRTSKTAFWKVEDVLPKLVSFVFEALADAPSMLVLTCHDPGITAEALRNLTLDAAAKAERNVIARELGITDSFSRVLSSGSLALLE